MLHIRPYPSPLSITQHKPRPWLQLCTLTLCLLSPLNSQAQKLAPSILLNNKPLLATVPKTQAVDRIVAIVGNESISLLELDSRIKLIEYQVGRGNQPLPPPALLQKQVLERMILERAQLQLLREGSTTARLDDVTLDRAVARIAEQNQTSVQQLRDQMERAGLRFNQFREDIRTEILLSRLREREVDSRIQVTENEIDRFIAEQAGLDPNMDSTEYNISQIILALPDQPTADQLKAKRVQADALVERLNKGEDFGTLAAEFSSEYDATTQGNLGWKTGDKLPKLFLDAVTGLKKNQLAPIVRSAKGLHILRLNEQRKTEIQIKSAPVTLTRVRHILIKPNEVISSDDARKKLFELKARLDSRSATFEELARQFSSDGSAARGGDLGFVYPGDTVPEFERVMDALKPNQISEPIQTPFGWHLIQLIERKKDNVSADRQRLLARQFLRERKSDEAFQDWLRQLRDRTYVEYRLDDPAS
jgi:peptidyl-prolyl cis-trans isomerase SurA